MDSLWQKIGLTDHLTQDAIAVCTDSVLQQLAPLKTDAIFKLVADDVSCAQSLQGIDKTSISSLRDWLCDLVAKSNKKISNTELRQFMEILRALPAEDRAERAVQFAKERRAIPNLVNAINDIELTLVSYWVHDTHTERITIDDEKISRALDIFSKTIDVARLYEIKSILSLSDVCHVFQFIVDVTTNSNWWSLYSKNTLKSFFGLPIFPEQVANTNSAKALPLSVSHSLPNVSEMGLVLIDGSIVHWDPRESSEYQVIDPPRICSEYTTVISASAVPLSRFVVAILEKVDKKTSKRERILALWSTEDLASYAIIKQYNEQGTETAESPPNAVDVQLTSVGDFFIQTWVVNAANGRAFITDLCILCIRVNGSDLSSIHYADSENDTETSLLLHRLATGYVNHLDHGNLLTLENHEYKALQKMYIWSNGRRLDLSNVCVGPLAVWGNKFKFYIWEKSGDVVECSQSSHDPNVCKADVRYALPKKSVDQFKADIAKRVVTAIRL